MSDKSHQLWATVLMAQEDLITEHCFGDCGKAIVGGLMDETAGPLIPCKQESCPHEEKTLYAGEFAHDNQIYHVTLRKLRDR